MESYIRKKMNRQLLAFKLPRFAQITDVGLYLDQTVQYAGAFLKPVEEITGSMIRNYVKKDLIPHPIRKLYKREQIAILFFITLVKNVMSMEEIAKILDLRQRPIGELYDFFCEELERSIHTIVERPQSWEEAEDLQEDETRFLRQLVRLTAHKIYLDQYLIGLAQSPEPE